MLPATFLDTTIMHKHQEQIDKLVAFKQRDKFSTKAWNDRGLNPSSPEICTQLSTLLNSCVEKLISALDTNTTSTQVKTILKTELSKTDKVNYDTEENEFICELFYELATITKVDIKRNLNKWLYGDLAEFLKPQKNLETLTQPCSNCGTKLESYITQKEIGIPDSSWFIVKCANCKELNLLSPGPDIKELNFGNYEFIETLTKEQYSYDQAQARLEQIKLSNK